MTGFEERVGSALRTWVGAVMRRPREVAWAITAVTLVGAWWSLSHLGINTDTKRLMADDVPFRRTWIEFARHFPTLDDALLVVIDAKTPEQAREAAEGLSEKLREDRVTFNDVFIPGAGEFFERNGLLYRDPDDLEILIDHVAEVQPILAELTREPSVSNLARLVRLGIEREGAARRDWPSIFDRIGHATVAVYQEHPVRVSWEDVVLTGSAIDPSTRAVIVASPEIDYDQVFAAAEPIAAIRKAARNLGYTPDRGVRVRVTGNPALNYEEMSNMIWDVAIAGCFSIIFICGVLYIALRSFRLVSASAVNLVVGLVWTATFAAVAVGRLNLVSISFAVLFLGLGIDFAIHLAVHYEELRRRGIVHKRAMLDSMHSVGSALSICTVTTAIGFFAFAPTQFRGVAELGLIAGVGMFVIFFLTVTLFPALVEVWVRDKDDWPREEGRFRLASLSAAERHPGTTLAIAAVLAIGSVALLPRVTFHSDIVKMRPRHAESVQTFEDLLERPHTTPWQVDVLAPDLETAATVAAELRALPEVERAITLTDYVPADQEEKIEILEDLAMMLEVPGGPLEREPLSVEEQVQALRELHDWLDRDWLETSPSPFAASALRLRDRLAEFLARVEADPQADEALASLEEILLGGLPRQLEKLRAATRPEPFGLEDLPERLRNRMLAEDGSARVQVFPAENVSEEEALQRFVDAVTSVADNATGLATHIVEFSRATARSLRDALMISLGLVTLLLYLLWRRAAEVGLALAPLLLSAALACAAMVLIGQPFNFSNVIVIPLLLGIGVDSGIHLVHRSLHRHDHTEPDQGLTGTHTARAVFYSAVTTVTSFGSLSFSSHRGVASLGVLLVLGMIFALACNLLVLPALLRVYKSRRS